LKNRLTSSTTTMVGRPILLGGVIARIRSRAAATADREGQQAAKRHRRSRVVGTIRK
jgi:hypothetical protein